MHKPILSQRPQSATKLIGATHTFKCHFVSYPQLGPIQWVLGACFNCTNMKILQVMIQCTRKRTVNLINCCCWLNEP